jgi:hypothetical protein
MKKLTFLEWLWDYVKWVLPKLTLISVAWSVSSWFFRLAAKTPVPREVAAEIGSLFSMTNSIGFVVLFCILSMLVGTADVARNLARRKSGVWHRIGRARGIISLAANTMLGRLMLPLVVGFSGAHHQAGGLAVSSLVPLAMILTLMSGYFHFVGLKDREAFTAITYVFDASPDAKVGDLRHATEGRLNEVLGRFSWIDSANLVSECEVATLTVILSFTLPRSAWSEDGAEIERWTLFNESLEREWVEAGLQVRKLEPALNAAVPPLGPRSRGGRFAVAFGRRAMRSIRSWL